MFEQTIPVEMKLKREKSIALLSRLPGFSDKEVELINAMTESFYIEGMHRMVEMMKMIAEGRITLDAFKKTIENEK